MCHEISPLQAPEHFIPRIDWQQSREPMSMFALSSATQQGETELIGKSGPSKAPVGRPRPVDRSRFDVCANIISVVLTDPLISIATGAKDGRQGKISLEIARVC